MIINNLLFLIIKEGKFKLWIVIFLEYFFVDESINKKLEKRIYDKMEELLVTGGVVSSGGGDAVHGKCFHCGGCCIAKAAEE